MDGPWSRNAATDRPRNPRRTLTAVRSAPSASSSVVGAGAYPVRSTSRARWPTSPSTASSCSSPAVDPPGWSRRADCIASTRWSAYRTGDRPGGRGVPARRSATSTERHAAATRWTGGRRLRRSRRAPSRTTRAHTTPRTTSTTTSAVGVPELAAVAVLGVLPVAAEVGVDVDGDDVEDGVVADVVVGTVGAGAVVGTAPGTVGLGGAIGTCPMTPSGLCSPEMWPGVGSKETQPSSRPRYTSGQAWASRRARRSDCRSARRR